jgi:hypothetical protein
MIVVIQLWRETRLRSSLLFLDMCAAGFIHNGPLYGAIV